MSTIIEYLRDFMNYANEEGKRIAENIGIGFSKLYKYVDPTNPTAIASSKMEYKERQSPKTIAEHLGQMGVDIVSYLVPNQPLRIGITALSQFGQHPDNITEVVKNTAYAYTPAASSSRIINAGKNLIQSIGIEGAYSTITGERPDVYNIIGSGIAAALTKGKTRPIVNTTLHSLGSGEVNKSLLKNFTNELIELEKSGIKDKYKLLKDKYFSNQKIKEQLAKEYAEKIINAYNQMEKPNSFRLEKIANKLREIGGDRLYKLYLKNTKNTNDVAAIRKAIKEFINTEKDPQLNKKAKMLYNKIAPLHELSVLKVVFGDDINRKIGKRTVKDLIQNFIDKQILVKNDDFFNIVNKYIESKNLNPYEVQQTIFENLNQVKREVEPEKLTTIIEDETPQLKELFNKYGIKEKGKIVATQTQGGVYTDNPNTVVSQYIFSSIAEGRKPSNLPVGKIRIPEMQSVELPPNPYAKQKDSSIELYSLIDPTKLFKNVYEWFKPDYSLKTYRDIENITIANLLEENKFRPLTLLKVIADKSGIDYDKVIKLHSINGGDVKKTIESIAKNVNNDMFWAKLDDIDYDKEYLNALKTIIKKHNVNNVKFTSLSPKEQAFIIDYFDKINPLIDKLPLDKELLKKYSGKTVMEIFDVAPEYEKAKIMRALDKYKSKLIRTSVPLYKEIHDTILNYYRTALLTSPSTHIKNITSNTTMGIVKILDDLNYKLLEGKPKEGLLEFKNDIKGYLSFWKEYFTNQAKFKAFIEQLALNPKFDAEMVSTKNPIYKLLGKEDAFFKMMVIYTEAMKRGIPLEEAMYNKEIVEKAFEYTFTKDTKLTHVVKQFADTVPLIKFLVPFPRTPTNILQEAFKRVAPHFHDKRQLAKFLTTLELAALGYIALNEKENETINELTEPIGKAVTIYKDALNEFVETGNYKKALDKLIDGILDITNTSSLAQLNNGLFNLIHGKFERVGKTIVAGMVPTVIKRVAVGTHPYAVERKTIKDYLFSSLPQYRSKLRPYRIAGQPVRLNVDNPIEALFIPRVAPRLNPIQKIYLKQKK